MINMPPPLMIYVLPLLMNTTMRTLIVSCLTLRAAISQADADDVAAVADGDTNKAIARRLNISVHTVKFHVEAVFRKLGARTRTEAVAKASEWRRDETMTF
jgi:DNA-binding CsgD family transcriptional regulator